MTLYSQVIIKGSKTTIFLPATSRCKKIATVNYIYPIGGGKMGVICKFAKWGLPDFRKGKAFA